ncbi:MAG TPA: LLM class flavin-dependent oxidoreductase [Anaerolineales bacterium]|nr:LLM class flavin-dependent oxidoreductase [Anaerolineales bacterium]
MPELVRPIGIGLAGRGKVTDIIRWADEARRSGIHIVWIHDTPYERDSITHAAAIATHVPHIRIGLAAISVYTRHPAVTAMTVSSLDEMAPERIVLALGTTIPLRLAQMGIPYSPQAGIESVSRAMDLIRSMWAGGRYPSAAPDLPPIQPMFPPLHRVPIYIAAYRTPFLQLAGQKADGYIARPAESIPNLKRLLGRLYKSAQQAGRDPKSIEISGYLLTYIDKSRRDALNRAKREPFVIYMMSVLSNFSLQQAGFEPALRDQIAAAWRAEEYHRAAELIPDEMLDAFMLCGTAEDAAGAAARYNQAGMTTPILQPVLQEEDQIQKILQAAQLYGSSAAKTAPAVREEAVQVTARARMDARDGLNHFERALRTGGGWTEITRPFSYTISLMPVLAASALAYSRGLLNTQLMMVTLAASLLLQIGANIINEIYDVRYGVDSITSPRASQALLKGRLRENGAFALAFGSFLLAVLFGVYLIAARGAMILLLGAVGLGLAYGYTAPPLQYKYKALGLPFMFLAFGPLMAGGAYYAITGSFSTLAILMSVPLGLLVAAIGHGNEWRDIADDARYGFGTYSGLVGRKWAHLTYIGLVTAAYLFIGLAVLFNMLPPAVLLALLSMPFFVRSIRSAEMGLNGVPRAIARIDLETAQLHAAFGILYVFGIVLGRTL